jgi:hypothetical protein
MMRPGPNLDAALETIAAAARDAGRDPTAIQMEGRVEWTPDDHDAFGRRLERWQALGATHMTVNTMHLGLETVDDHLAALAAAAGIAGLDHH